MVLIDISYQSGYIRRKLRCVVFDEEAVQQTGWDSDSKVV